MNDNATFPSKDAAGAAPLPPWSECNVFCIHGYAATGIAPCGWRGRLQDASAVTPEAPLRCPRCDGATLMRIRASMA